MAANTINRQVVRDYLAGLFEAALTGAGNPVEAVYNYKIGDFAESPVILVYAAGAERAKAGLGPSPTFDTSFNLYVDLWVVAADEAAGWTVANAEDSLDDIGKAIADVIADNWQAEGYWDELDFAGGFSTIFEVTTKGGQSYLVERFLVTTTTYNK